MKSLTAMLAAVSILLGTGCVVSPATMAAMQPKHYAKSPTFDGKPVWRTAVLPPAFASAEPGGAISAVYDYAGMALMRTGRFTVVDRSLVDRLLEEQEFAYSGAVDAGTAARLGKLLGAEAVFTVNINSIRHDDFFDEPEQRDAGLHVKLIAVETAEVLYSAAGEGSSFEGAEEALRSALEVALYGLAAK